MSYINDALRKVKKEKGTDYTLCSDTIFDEAKKPARRTVLRPLITGAGVILLVAIVSVAWWWLDLTKGRSAGTIQVVQVPPVVTEEPAVSVPEAAPAPEAQLDASAEQSSNEAAKTPVEQPVTGETPHQKAVKENEEYSTAAVTEPEKSLQEKPAPVDVKRTYERALKAHHAGKLSEAAKFYREVIKADPLHVSAWNNLGVVRMSEKKYGMAAGNFKEALKIQHDHASAHYNLACLYARKGDKKEGLYYLKNAIAADPEARKWAQQDHDFNNLAGLPEFRQLVEAGDN